MKTFGNIPKKYANPETASTYLTSIPYDGTSTWGKGADKGFEAFMEAADNLELYDIETNTEVYRNGIHITQPVLDADDPEKMVSASYYRTKEMLQTGKFLSFFGGEHSISIGIIKAFYEHFTDFSVLQFDAHTDLRPTYNGSPFNHACALYDASCHTNLVQVGIRSMDKTECKFIKKGNCFFAHEMIKNINWKQDVISKLTENVYITFDLDVFDPSIMPSTGTPEPGGMLWYDTLQFLRKVFCEKNVVGFDIVELAPNPLNKAPDFLSAKLFYKMLSYKFDHL